MTDNEKMIEAEETEAEVLEDTADAHTPLSAITRFFKTPNTLSELVISGAFLLLSLYVLIYYITGPALGYFHSDCADSLIWSLVMIESGEVLSEDFAYAAILPFGASLWMVPILKIFGFTMQAQVISMCIFAVVFVASALFMFRSMKWRYSLSSAAVFCLSMLLSGSVKLREIMWEHVIYYSLGILFLMLLLGLSFRLYDKLSSDMSDKKNKTHAVIWGVLLALLSAGCATDGFQMLALTVLAVGAALVAYTIFDGENKLSSPTAMNAYSICAVMIVGVTVGIVLLNIFTHGGKIYSAYGNAYSTWSSIDQWADNALAFPKQYFTLFGTVSEAGSSLFSASSIFVLVKLLSAAVLLVCPFILLFSYNRLKDKYSKMVVWAYLVVFGVTAVGFVLGQLSNVNWRLVPFLGASIIATVVYIKHLIGNTVVCRRVGVILAAVLLCTSLMNAADISNMSRDFGKDDPLQKVAEALEEKGYDRGYATFWNASETELRSDGKVKVINVTVENGRVYKRDYQTMNYWFDDVEGQETYFLLLDTNEYASVMTGSYFRELCDSRNLVDNFSCGDYYILVFDGNLFLE